MTEQNKKYVIAGGTVLAIYVAYRLYKKNEENKAVEAAKQKALAGAKTSTATPGIVAAMDAVAPVATASFVSSQADPDMVANSF